MSFQAICQVCESAPARHTCEQCGTQVCRDHFERRHGVCSRCASSLGGMSDDVDTLR